MRILLSVMVAALVALPARGLSQPSGFEELDANGDGFISQEEAAANEALVRQWRDLDRDEDGTLSPGEFSAFEQRRAEDAGLQTDE